MNTQDKYPTSMRVLHWLMAILIFGQIFGGWFMTPYDEAREPLVGQLYWGTSRSVCWPSCSSSSA